MEGDIFHILNRGVEKRKIFLRQKDYLRFVHNLYDFNNADNVFLSYYNRRGQHNYRTNYGTARSVEQLVDVLGWALVANHFHLLVHERVDGGSGVYTQKITGGYTLHFNNENERCGVLFQGRSKIIPVTKERYFLHLPYYILANVIKRIEPNWKEQGIKNFKKVIDYLENYKWSAFQDLIGKSNFPFVINKELFYEFFDTDEKRFKKEFINWLNDYNPTEVRDP
ncbi:MAG: hypothetical protein UU71_C0003G0019 [Parcubacteria group bacterium GW2011_GWB1_41_6]|nr:MAG: hypothetical protein UU71_C0003G0019 [Parcubacteria group bacterium GW2011_GWB1_41_6]KKS34692.1 MAG: hypothetical protein UU96_C0001G0047 [Parcubacteria group bacterium GW2011_GWC2_42_13]KKS58312.1 MAG: hypothetical protein UV22_C0001G0019 [Parcubacteria group bacterium GW2011_GWA2_42_35]